LENQDIISKDLRLKFDPLGADLVISNDGDLSVISKETNLSQAIFTRLLTQKGELQDLGHPEYGSRLHEMIGEINNEVTRLKIKAIVRECLAQELRIKKVTGIDIIADKSNLHAVKIYITVLPVNSAFYLSITFPFSLEG
jgi:phage baseplate assembly protein W